MSTRGGALLRSRPTRLVTDAVVVVAAGVVVVGLCGSSEIGGVLPQPASGQALTLAAASAAAAAAILAALASLLVEDPRVRWIAAALTLYAVVVLPTTAVPVGPDDLALPAALLVAQVVTTGMLVAAVRPPPRVGAVGTWVVTAAGAGAAGLALAAPAVAPALVRALTTGPIAAIAVLVGWTAVAAAVVVEGYRRRSTPRWRIGLGLVVLSLAQLQRVLTTPGGPPVDLLFAGLRLFGLLVVTAGLAQLVQRILTELRSRQFEQQDELSRAALHMERAAEFAAERDHELRNGLAGLAGITHLLSSRVPGDDHARLRHAVLAELGRLHTILDSGVLDGADLEGADLEGADPEGADPRGADPRGDPRRADPGGADPSRGDRAGGGPGGGDPDGAYAVEPVLAGLVTLRRSTGSAVDLQVETGLRARGHPAVLAQVVTNLLANCERHAPGARITVRAHRLGDDAVVEVRDEGPGLPADEAARLLHRGVHDVGAGGTGLGLHISRQLIEREGGSLSLRTVADPRGCVARTTVPAATVPSTAPLRP